MIRSKLVVALAATGLAVGAAATTAATAKPAKPAPRNATIKTVERTTFKINRYVQDEMRFAPGTLSIKSGGTLTVINKQKQEPHTISFVRASQLPRTNKQINNCGNGPKTICRALGIKHEVNFQTQQVGKPVVDPGTPGADGPGNSWFIAPGGSVKFKVSAKKGTVLHFMCALHPWMQGRIVVK
jgi:plastocyanin